MKRSAAIDEFDLPKIGPIIDFHSVILRLRWVRSMKMMPTERRAMRGP